MHSASADVWERSRDKTVFIPMAGVAEPQDKVLGSDVTVTSDQHCPVTAFLGDACTRGRILRRLRTVISVTVAV